jgi:hypothetical protein
MDGTFRYVPCATDTSRLCTQQMTPQPPIYWGAHAGFPHAVIGDESLQTDYTVAADVLFTQHGSSAGVIDRYSSYTGAISSFRGYIFALDDGGAWQLLRNSRAVGVSVMGHGTLAVPPGVGTWHRLALTVKGSTQSGSIDGRQVVSASDTDPNYVTGIAGVEAGATLNSAQNAWTGTSWPIVQFRDLTVLPPARGTGHPTQVSGDVTPALALGVGAHSSFGAFTPGVAKDYQASVDATVTATARDAALTVVDPSATNPGHLRNGAFVMPRALQVAAASPAAGTHEYVAVGGSPAPLLGYSGPIAADPVTITFKQPMSATDALASGTYGTTLTFSLSTTTP